MKPVPCRLAPQFVPRIWGARSLAPLYPEKTNLAEPIGEVWLTGNDCIFADGPYAGQRLADVWRAMPAEWAGTRLDTSRPFPLLVKFLFPEDILSIQVHPDDDYARRHEAHTGWTGKTEMWHAVAARPGAEVLVGLKPDVTPDSFRRAIADGTAENCLTPIPVTAGDTIFVPAGTVHTIGPGLVLCEIQQNSDLTYRVFDYNRPGLDGKPRPLHIDKALSVTRFGKQIGGKLPGLRFVGQGGSETFHVICPYFATERWELTAPREPETTRENFELLVLLDGEGALQWESEQTAYAGAQVWLIPAALKYRISPSNPTSLLRTYLPDVKRVARQLESRGAGDAARLGFVFRR
ncbi:MAG: type I phosphomannose isomerase catalytic subunit [Candidatus Acidiferrales bacterium]